MRRIERLSLALMVGVPAFMLRAGQSKRVHLVASDSRWDISVTGSPIEGAVHDGWAIDDCASACKIPEDLSSCRIEGIHLPRVGTCIHNGVCDTHRAGVNGARSGVCNLPENLPSGDIESAPRPPRNLLSRGLQGIGEMIVISDRYINALTVS